MFRLILGSRARMIASFVVLETMCAGYGHWLAAYVRTEADSVVTNLYLILGWVALMMAAGFPLSVLIGELLWGPRWTRMSFLGWTPDPDEVQPEDIRDRGFAYYLVLALTIAVSYLGNDLLQGNFFAWYAARGYALTQLRAGDPEERVQAIEELSTSDDPSMRRLVVRGLDDPDPRVRAVAARATGWEAIDEALPRLLELARSDPDPVVRGAAALAAGQTRGPGVVEILEDLVRRERDQEAMRGIIGGLGMRRAGADAMMSFLTGPNGGSEEVRRAAIWALGRIKDPGSREVLDHILLDESQALGTRCAALHAIAKVREDEDRVPRSIRRVIADQRHLDDYCPRLFVTALVRERCFEFLNSRASRGYQGPCIDLQVSSPEPFGSKALRAGAYVAGKASMDWLAAVNHDPSYSDVLRNQAAELFYELKGM